jgi:ABC-type dipeptide/oligopeptide/nickel transport system permease component
MTEFERDLEKIKEKFKKQTLVCAWSYYRMVLFHFHSLKIISFDEMTNYNKKVAEKVFENLREMFKPDKEISEDFINWVEEVVMEEFKEWDNPLKEV